ncbi:MAG: DUF5681 domain-containing protein [Nitrospinota bacterium]|nr:DUF5681 domain-containing protein [Nitrospinota bacterium]
MTDNTEKKLRNLKPWQPGQSGNLKGRPKGARNKLSDDFVLALYDNFTKHGEEAIDTVRKDKPEVYLQIISKLLPRDIKLESTVTLKKIAHVIVDVLDQEDKETINLPGPMQDAGVKGGTHETE